MVRSRDALRRRELLAACGAVATAGFAGCSGGSDGASGPYDGWLENANGFESVRDRTDASQIEIDVGAEGGLTFAPTAVQIAPGTEVVWKWTGKGGAHNVRERDGAFESDLVSEADHTFRHAFNSTGIYRYVCDPHEPRGMKGVVEVLQQ